MQLKLQMFLRFEAQILPRVTLHYVGDRVDISCPCEPKPSAVETATYTYDCIHYSNRLTLEGESIVEDILIQGYGENYATRFLLWWCHDVVVMSWCCSYVTMMSWCCSYVMMMSRCFSYVMMTLWLWWYGIGLSSSAYFF